MSEPNPLSALHATPATVTAATPPPSTATLNNVSATVALWDPGWDLGPAGGAVILQVASGQGALAVIFATGQPGAGSAPVDGVGYAAGLTPVQGSPGAAWIGKSDVAGGLTGFLASNPNFSWPATPFYFWASYRPDGTITIGLDKFVGQNVLTQYTDSAPVAGARYVGLLLPSGGPVSVSELQIVPNTPVPYQIIQENIPAPDPTGSDYVSLTVITSATQQSFNGSPQYVKNIEISGMAVTTAGGQSALAALSGEADIVSLTIYADTLEIDRTLTLPQTNVTIYARQLTFTGSAAKIITTPLFVQNTPAATVAGDKGLTGGHVTLNIGGFTAQNGASPAFVLTGGPGQPGGPGVTPLTTNMPGTPFDPFYPEGGPDESGFGGANVVYYTYSYVDTEDSPTSDDHSTQGTQAWPENGPAAQAAGVPGDGGDGGAFVSTVDLQSLVSQAGGISASPGLPNPTPGGAAATPSPAYWQIYSYEYHGGCQQGNPNISWQNPSNSSTAGASAPSPGPANATGNAGASSVSGSTTYSWLHPYNLQVALRYAKDVYLSGGFAAAQQILSTYTQALTAYTNPPATYQVAFAQAAQASASLLNRLAANLDYFGNPAGWVPMLSFQSNLAIYQAEVTASIQQMYLAYRIQKAAASAAAAAAMLGTGIAQLQSEISAALVAYAAADAELPNIDAQMSNVLNQLGTLQPRLDDLQKQLLQEAQHDVEEEHEALFFVRILAGICQLFPVGQPELGALGSGLNILSNIDTTEPLKSFDQLSSLLQSYQKENPTAAAAQTKQDQQNADVGNAADAGPNAASLIKASIGVVNGLKTITSGFQSLHVSDAEVQAKLQEIEAANVAYQFYVQQIQALNALKTTLEAQLNTTLQQLTSANNVINSGLLKVDSMYTQRALDFAQLDHQAILFAKEMGQAARERLVKYQYFLIKSYEYLVLQPYGQADYQLNSVVNAFASLESNRNADGTLSSADYTNLATVYRTILVNIADQILTQYEQQPIQTRTTFVVPLNQAQLDLLNQGQATINLLEMDQLDYNWQGIRVTNIATNYIELSDGSSASSTGANQAASAAGAPALNQVQLTFSHAGFSSLRNQGIVYAFNPNDDPNSESGNMTWGTTFNLQGSGSNRLVPVVPDPATASMLASLLTSISGINTAPLSDYQPSAADDLSIAMAVYPSGAAATITKLTLQFDFTFTQAPANEAVLAIQTVGTTNPLILLNATDLGGNGSGRGSFYRIFPQNQSVQVTAPATFGAFRFAQWQAPNGSVVSTSRSIQCLLSGNLLLQCVYQPQPS